MTLTRSDITQIIFGALPMKGLRLIFMGLFLCAQSYGAAHTAEAAVNGHEHGCVVCDIALPEVDLDLLEPPMPVMVRPSSVFSPFTAAWPAAGVIISHCGPAPPVRGPPQL